MGFLGFIKKIGRGIGKGFRRVGDVIKDPRKIGEVAKEALGTIAKPAQMLLDMGASNIPIVGTGLKAITKGKDAVELVEKLGKGDIAGAVKKGVGIGLSASPLGQIERAGRLVKEFQKFRG